MAEVVGLHNPTPAELQSMNYNYYVTLASITILVYDFLLTFPAEVERFWLIGRPNCARFLFYTNRYLVILGYIPILIENFWATYHPVKLQVCRNLQLYHQYFSTTVQVVAATMLIMRVYALYKRNVHVLVFLVAISSILLAIGCWAAFGGENNTVDNYDVLVYIGCGVYVSHSRAIRTAASWVSMFVFDLVIFSMTLYRVITLPRSNNVSLLTVFMRDGAMYFVILTVANLVNILILVLGGPLTRSLGTNFTNAITSVMITRLVLNLRDPSLVPLPEPIATEDMTHANFTFVEPHYPTELSDGGGFADDGSTRDIGRGNGRHSYEGSRNVDPWSAGSDIELHRIGA